MTDRTQTLKDTLISSSIKWYGGNDGTNHKNGLKSMLVKACSQKEKMEIFLPKLLLTIPHTGKLESQSALMGRQIRVPLTFYIFYK